ncbi:pimeloyl-ACP methyl ester carboxylesterase [Streptosporangium becharense]|uniref:Pimeloyl-ACP methyl ester carboxylesterase n=1 Tax=Streptosporangium becharense TaxID=1816182 RepID=A0A7W9MIP5_9ACTN|nr:alpha/beta hydrolase [Streptosporangium becharense]MBB2911081.1 pimeloyl-ACP methyl ester carboxylesterase [Streptosporangium becharense]MBB5821861.1 pimeloyl-ACP methyl ester carboxylesterase [Streptosporangium becharense]
MSKAGSGRERPARRRWLRWTGRVLGGALVTLLVLAAAGYGAETIAQGGDATRHPAPGKLVDVGGHRLHLRCVGSGSPTVILDAGWGEASATWDDVQTALARRSLRSCSYDRAGYGWSEAGPGPRDATRAAEELHTLLERAGEKGPFVLAGHSYGGHVLRMLAHRHPERMAGMVLVDVTEASEPAIAATRDLTSVIVGQMRLYQAAARIGLARLFGDRLAVADSPALATKHAPVVYGPGSMGTAAEEAASFVTSSEQVHATERPGEWGEKPVVVIGARGSMSAGYYEGVARLSAHGRYVAAGTERHYIHLAEPELVVGAIAEVAAASRP